MNEKTGDKKSFLKGALILSLAGLLVRFMGVFFRVPLGNLLSLEAMSYYSAAYPIFAFFIAITTTGFPTAVASLIAEYKATGKTANIRVVQKASLIVMTSIGVFGFFVLFVFAGAISKAIGNEGAALSLMALAPGVLFCSWLSVYRGFFQGFQRMNPFAVSMLVEQFVRVVVGLGLAAFLLSFGGEQAAAGATLGATVGGLISFIWIFWDYYRLSRRGELYNPLGERISMKSRSTAYDNLALAFVRNTPSSLRHITNRMLKIAIPITISASVLPLVGIIDVAMVVNRLTDIGFSSEAAKEMFTMMSGYATTLINFPLAIVTGLQISVVPAVTAVFSIRDFKEVRRLVRSALKVNSLITIPSAFGLAVLATPIVGLLYPAQVDAIEPTGKILSMLAFSVFFLGGFLVTSSVYQSVKKTMIPVQNLLIGVAAKIVLTYVLVGIPDLNIIGACIATVACYFVAWILNLLRLRVYVDIDYDPANTYTKPVIASMAMALTASLSYKLIFAVLGKNSVATLGAITLAVLVYVFVVLWMRILRRDDYEMLPAGSKIRALEQKIFKSRATGTKKRQ